MKKLLNLVKSKYTLSFIEWAIDNAIKSEKSNFEITRICVAWSIDTNTPAYDFRIELESYILEQKSLIK